MRKLRVGTLPEATHCWVAEPDLDPGCLTPQTGLLTSILDVWPEGILETILFSVFQTVLFRVLSALPATVGGRLGHQVDHSGWGWYAGTTELHQFGLLSVPLLRGSSWRKDSMALKRLQTTSPGQLLPSKEETKNPQGFGPSSKMSRSRASTGTQPWGLFPQHYTAWTAQERATGQHIRDHRALSWLGFDEVTSEAPSGPKSPSYTHSWQKPTSTFQTSTQKDNTHWGIYVLAI